MSRRYRKSGQIDFYEPEPQNSGGWVGAVVVGLILLFVVAQCSGG